MKILTLLVALLFLQSTEIPPVPSTTPSTVPVLPDPARVELLTLSRDVAITQTRLTSAALAVEKAKREQEKAQAEFNTKFNELQTAYDKHRIPGWSLDPLSLIYARPPETDPKEKEAK